MYKGKLIVIEGLDGSGKATEQKELAKRLKRDGYQVALIDFPQYYDNFFGKLVGDALAGKFGDWIAVDPHIASVIYAADRWESKDKIESWLKAGYIVIADRYATSNQLFQAGKIHDKRKREKFIKWLDKLEYEVFGIPRPDMVIYLDVPAEVAIEMVRKAKKEKRYAKGKNDLHERSLELLVQTYRNAVEFMASYEGWELVQCVKDGKLLPIEEIAEKIYRLVVARLKRV